MAFCPETPKEESRNYHSLDSHFGSVSLILTLSQSRVTTFIVGVLGLRPNGLGSMLAKGGISWDFRRIILEGRFEILYNQKGSNGKGMVVSGGFGK